MLSWSGGTIMEMDSEPKILSRMIRIEERRIARGKFFCGFSTSVT